MNFTTQILLASLALFAGVLACVEIGRRIGRRSPARLDPRITGVQTIEAAVLGLLGLLIAFSFGGATSRFDDQRALLINEVNAVETAYMRLDLLPEPSQRAVREEFWRYTEARLESHIHWIEAPHDMTIAMPTIKLQREVWTAAVAAVAGERVAATLVLPPINEMFEAAREVSAAKRKHPPRIILGMLFALSLISALMAGYDMGRSRSRNPLHVVGLALVLAVTIFVVLDIEHPRIGQARIAELDRALVTLRERMAMP